jgi:flagellar hook-length control protein FliK
MSNDIGSVIVPTTATPLAGADAGRGVPAPDREASDFDAVLAGVPQSDAGAPLEPRSDTASPEAATEVPVAAIGAPPHPLQPRPEAAANAGDDALLRIASNIDLSRLLAATQAQDTDAAPIAGATAAPLPETLRDEAPAPIPPRAGAGDAIDAARALTILRLPQAFRGLAASNELGAEAVDPSLPATPTQAAATTEQPAAAPRNSPGPLMLLQGLGNGPMGAVIGLPPSIGAALSALEAANDAQAPTPPGPGGACAELNLLASQLAPDTGTTATLETLGAPAPAAAASGTASARNESVPGIANSLQHPQWGAEFAQRVTLMLREQLTEADIRITPPELGPIEVKLKLDGERLHAQFVAQHAEVREVLSSNLNRLRELLAGEGLTLGQAFVGQHAQGQNGSGTFAQSGDAGRDDPFASAQVERAASIPARVLAARIGLLDEFA